MVLKIPLFGVYDNKKTQENFSQLFTRTMKIQFLSFFFFFARGPGLRTSQHSDTNSVTVFILAALAADASFTIYTYTVGCLAILAFNSFLDESGPQHNFSFSSVAQASLLVGMAKRCIKKSSACLLACLLQPNCRADLAKIGRGGNHWRPGI